MRWWIFFFLLWNAAWARPAWVERRGDELNVKLRGICLGNWWVPEGYMFGFEKSTSPTQIERVVLELLGPEESTSFWRAYRERFITRQDLENIARAGFNAVRVPLHHKFLRDARERERLDWLIRECARLDLWVLPDLHAAPGGQTGDNIDDGASYPWLFESPAALQLSADLWRELAGRYADEPTVLGWELLNEPIPNWPGYTELHPKLDRAYRQMAAAIREVDSRHLILLDGAEWATNFQEVSSDWDERLVLAFHRYWADPSPAGIQPYLALRKGRGLPIVMTESGENTREWIAEFRRTLEAHNIPWFFWPYKKMRTDSCLAVIPTPAHWEQVMAYADGLGLSGEERRKLRPSRAVCRAAFQELLDNLQRCQWQDGFVRALID